MRSSAENAPSFLQRDIGFDRNGVGPNHRSVGASLALDLTTLCIPVNTNKTKRVDTHWLGGSRASTQRPVSQREKQRTAGSDERGPRRAASPQSSSY